MENEERREYGRVPFVVPVNVSYNRGTLKGYWSRDLSEGGLRLEFLPIPITSEVRVIIPLGGDSGAHHCVVNAEVVWRNFRATGIRFLDPPEEVLEFVRQVVTDQQMN